MPVLKLVTLFRRPPEAQQRHRSDSTGQLHPEIGGAEAHWVASQAGLPVRLSKSIRLAHGDSLKSPAPRTGASSSSWSTQVPVRRQRQPAVGRGCEAGAGARLARDARVRHLREVDPGRCGAVRVIMVSGTDVCVRRSSRQEPVDHRAAEDAAE
jgi:hypothetical protein